MLVCASSQEGFGIPILEGLAAGVPVVAADCPAAREVGGDAVRYYPARDDAALADAVESALTGRHDPMPGRERAASYSWDRCAAEHARLIESLVSAAQA